MNTADRLAQGVADLRAGRNQEAADHLAEVWADEELSAAEDLVDIRARAGSLYVQALVQLGQPRAADRPCRDVIRLLRKLRDRDGLTEVRRLQDQIVRALAHDREAEERASAQRRIASTPLEDLLEGVTGEERIAVHVRKANALADAGELEVAVRVARLGLQLAEEAQHITWQVMAHMALARARPHVARDHLVRAHGIADSHEEFNLVSMVARAAEVAEVELPRAWIGARPEDT